MNRITQILTTLGLCALFGASSLLADTVTLKNGDTLTGKILKHADGMVTFKGALFGELTLKETDITSFKIGDKTTATTSAATPAKPATDPGAPPTTGTVVGAMLATSASNANRSNFSGQAGAPEKPVWTRDITFGGNYVGPTFVQGQIPGAPAGTTGEALGLTGRVIGLQGSASFMRATNKQVHALDLKYAYTDYEPAGTQTDNYSAAFMWNRKLSERYYTVSRTSYSVDQVRNIDYSAVQLFGVGYKIKDTQQTKLDFVPGILLMQEAKGNQFDDEFQYGAGFLQNFVYYFSTTASFEQRVLFRQSFEESEVYALDAYVGFKGMLSAKLGLTVGLSYTYDNTLGPVSFPFNGATVTLLAQEKDQLTITSGIQYKF